MILPCGTSTSSGVMPIAPLLERCCMGVVSQIKDLDNSSSAVPYNSIQRFALLNMRKHRIIQKASLAQFSLYKV